MGKSRNRPRGNYHAKQYQSVDQHGVRNGPRSAEQRGVCGPANSDSGRIVAMPARGDDAHISGGDDDGSPERVRGVRDQHARRLRIHWGAESAIVRAFSAENANRIVNDPTVFPYVSVPGIDRIDLTQALDDPRHVCIEAIDDEGNVGGVVVFFQQEPGIYEFHTNFLPPWRGSFVLEALNRSLAYMFISTDCAELLTRVPAFNKAAEIGARRIGATREFTRVRSWNTVDGLVDCSFWSISYASWSREQAESVHWGAWFHEQLDRAFVAQGVEKRNPRADEECRDLRAGLAVQMIFAGQVEKAIVLYNQWARFAGHGVISLVLRNPVIVDVGDALLQFDGDHMKVLKCR